MGTIVHVSTVHPRYDVRILAKECGTLVASGLKTCFVVHDGRGPETVHGVEIFDLGAAPSNRLLRVLVGAWRVLRCSCVRNAAVVHFHDPELLPVGLCLKLLGRTVIYDAHEDVPRQIESKPWISPWLRPAVAACVEWLERFVATRLDAVVAATPLIGRRFISFNPRTVVVRNYPLLEEFARGRPRQHATGTVCYVGAITRERGLLVLLDALEILGNVRVVICGPFESRAFEAELRRHPGWRFVDYRGVVGRSEVADVLARCDVGLVTLLPTPNQIEALPVKMFEYMAAGTACLVSDFPLWREIAQESGAGVCVDPTSPAAIAKALRSMLDSPDELIRMGRAGQEAVVGRYSWQTEGRALVDLYKVVTTWKPAHRV